MKTVLFIFALFFHVLLIVVSTRNARYGTGQVSTEKRTIAVKTIRPPARMMDLKEFENNHPDHPDIERHKITSLILDVNKHSPSDSAGCDSKVPGNHR